MPLRWLVTDFESVNVAVGIKKVGAWRYSEDIETEVLTINWSVMGEPWRAWQPGQDPAELLAHVNDPDMTFISFGDFERAMWLNQMVAVHGFPKLGNSRWHDIQAAAAMKNMPKDLDKLLRVTHLGNKDMEGNKLTIGLSKMDRKGNAPVRTPAIITRVVEYCGNDVMDEVAAHNYLGWLQPGERRYWLLNQRINQRGLRLDLDYISACKKIAADASVPLLAEFQRLTGLKPTQNKKLMGWLSEQGVQLPNLTKETMSELFGGDDDDAEDDAGPLSEPAPGFLSTVRGLHLPDNVHRALSIRKLVGASSLAKLDAMEACVCADGRARGLLQYHGTGPGRSAGRLLQPHNFPKPTIKDSDGDQYEPEQLVDAIMTRDWEYVEMLIGPAIPTVVTGLRHAITSEPGRVLLSGDYAGIQARLVLAASGQHDKAAKMADPSVDIYCDMAQQIFKNPDITKANKGKYPKERGVGKNCVLGLGFQMAAPTFQVKYCRDRHIDFCKEVVRVYRKEWAPKVPYFWYGLEDAAAAAVWTEEPQEAFGVEYRIEEHWLVARLPSGRKIYYFHPRPVRSPAPWDPDQIKEGFVYQTLKSHVWVERSAFGGQLAENVIMGMEADIMRRAQLKLEDEGFPICLEVHDEIVAEPLKADADEKAFEQIMLDVPDWVKYIEVPIAVECWQGDRYRK